MEELVDRGAKLDLSRFDSPLDLSSYLDEHLREISKVERLLDDVSRRTRRVFGESNPKAREAEFELERVSRLLVRMVADKEDFQMRIHDKPPPLGRGMIY